MAPKVDDLAVNNGQLLVVGAASVRDCHNLLLTPYENVLVIGQPWDSERWVLSLGSKLTWLSYPREHHWQQRCANQEYGVLRANDDAKVCWWQLENCHPDLPSYSLNDFAVFEWSNCSGRYIKRQILKVNFDENEDWLADLLAPVPEVSSYKQGGAPAKGEVVVKTTDDNIYRFNEHQRVSVLNGPVGMEELDQLPAMDLRESMYLINVEEGEGDYQALMDILIDYAVENSMEYKTYTLLAEKWHTYTDHALYVCGSAEVLHKKLKGLGIDIGLQAVKNWTRHMTIGLMISVRSLRWPS